MRATGFISPLNGDIDMETSSPVDKRVRRMQSLLSLQLEAYALSGDFQSGSSSHPPYKRSSSSDTNTSASELCSSTGSDKAGSVDLPQACVATRLEKNCPCGLMHYSRDHGDDYGIMAYYGIPPSHGGSPSAPVPIPETT